ncbi:putative Zn finger-like uncharacterized protein [Pacificibacter maritimus]|uniref:Putative Zn finger-like uncharacterized protein n=1 Tax=Pacificibacter maritimus TaxID=762213 RepID=A0A3N4U712_9RHOB|nr:zinc-ribbon domain-containing protein [Pacificibacter maritimus]RPE66242.1 putative Zn finger-like uncharacterized protein [Pacificibacter maritimus]
MRLICPNCGAQYEVDAKVIPATGRDVQCSNCGHTWFQQSAEADADLAQEMGFELTAEDTVSDASIDAPEDMHDEPQVPNFSQEPYDEAEDQPAEGAEKDGVDQAPSDINVSQDVQSDEADESTTPPMQRSAVSDSVRDILRAEVEFDQAKRAPDTLETQPELGLEEASDQVKGLRERMARLRGLNPAEAVGGLASATSRKRRDLLPDIEEINSTLSAASERDEDGSIPDKQTRSNRAQQTGFTLTFITLITCVVILVLLYILAPLLAAKVPALAGLLESYVTSVNAFRSWLDNTLTAASSRLNALLGQLNGS